MCINYDGTHLPNKFLHAHQKSHVTLRFETGYLVHSIYKLCCYGRSAKPEASLSSKYFYIIVLHDCVPKQLASTSELSDSIYCVTSAEAHIFSGFFYILVIFRAAVYQKVTILFSLTHWIETVLYSHMFYAIFQFCAYKLKSNLRMEA